MKAVISPNVGELNSFLLEHEYPEAHPLSFLRNCVAIRIARHMDYEPSAFVWACWDPEGYRTVDFHACADQSVRGFWIEPVWRDIYTTFRLLGAHFITTSPTGPRAPLIRALMCRKCGFQSDEDGRLWLEVTENTNG